MIPNIIWQTHQWVEHKIPYPYNKNMLTWKNFNEDWDYRYLDRFQREQSIHDFAPELYEFYLTLPRIRQADLWRYVILYQHGGLYVDLDTVCTGGSLTNRFFDVLPEYDLIVNKNRDEDGNIANACIFASKNSPVIKEVLDRYIDYIKNNPSSSEDMAFFSNIVSSYPDQSVILYEELGIPADYTTEFPYEIGSMSINGVVTSFSDIGFLKKRSNE